MGTEVERIEGKQEELDSLKAIVSDGLATYLDVREAATRIRDELLYKLECDSWDEFCRTNWGHSGRHMNRQIAAHRYVQSLAFEPENVDEDDENEAGPIGPEVDTSERETKPARPIPANEHQARKAMAADKKAKEPKPAPPPVTDLIGREVPNKGLAKVFTEGIQEFNTLEALLDQSGRALLSICEQSYGFRIFLQTVQSDLKKVKTAVLHAKPFAICPYCKGEGTPGCSGCSSFGWVNKSTYDAAPAKDKK